MHIQKPSIYIRPKRLCNFVMTDSTSFNLRVFDSVCGYMGAEHSPTSVTCNMHILTMFHQNARKVFQVFHNRLGLAKQKINQNCFQNCLYKNKHLYIEVSLAKRAFYH